SDSESESDSEEYDINRKDRDKNRTTPRCVFIKDGQKRDDKYIARLIMKGINHQKVDMFSEQPAKVQEKKRPYIIRFINGKKFCEIATFIESTYLEWKTELKKLCICLSFDKDFK